MHNPFRYFNSSSEVIRLAVMMYVRYPLSLRQVEDLLLERGIDICHETVRYWWNRFGPLFAAAHLANIAVVIFGVLTVVAGVCALYLNARTSADLETESSRRWTPPAPGRRSPSVSCASSSSGSTRGG